MAAEPLNTCERAMDRPVALALEASCKLYRIQCHDLTHRIGPDSTLRSAANCERNIIQGIAICF